MDEAVYVIRLTNDDANCSSYPSSNNSGVVAHQLPSEQRYSATLVLGLGTVHICLGVLSSAFSILALFVETEANQYAAGLWTGVIYIGCGITAILAYSRWYIKRQIMWFLFGAVLSGASAIVCVTMTSLGVQLRKDRIGATLIDLVLRPYSAPGFDKAGEDMVTNAVTANIFVTAIVEVALSVLSIKVAYDGTRAREFNLSKSLRTKGGGGGGGCSLTNKKKASEFRRKEFVLSASLPPGYSTAGMLSHPGHLLCHLTDPTTNQFHVARSNPLRKDEDEFSVTSSSSSVGNHPRNMQTMTREDRVSLFLREAVQMAQTNAARTLDMYPEHTYGSAIV